MMDHLDDSTLIDRFNAGDDDAFRLLYERYSPWVHRLAYRLTGSESDALDVLQDTFTYLARRRGSLYLCAKMTTFLYPVVRNQSIAANRKRRRIGAIGLAELPQIAAESDDTDLAPLAAAMDRLPEEHREVVLLRFVQGLSMQDIAEAMDIPAGTVKSRLHHALRKLRDDPATRDYFPESP